MKSHDIPLRGQSLGGAVAAFWSTYINKIDRKGRVSIPATFRPHLIGKSFQGVVVFPAFRSPALECRSWEQMEELSASVDALPEFSAERDALAAAIFGSSVPLSFDPEGRINLPAHLAKHANLGAEAAFVGMGKSFQIWEPAAFKLFQKDAREKVAREGITVPRAPLGNMKGDAS